LGDRLSIRCFVLCGPGRAISGRALGLLFLFLGHQYVCWFGGHRDDQVFGGDWRAVHADCRAAAAGMDYAEGWWLWSRAAYGKQVSLYGRVRSVFYSRADGDGRFLVPRVALNIPDFTRYAKSQRAQMVGQALGLPTAMTLYAFIGVGGNFGVGGAFRCADLGPRGAAWEIQPAAGGVCRVDCADDCHVEYERGGQRGSPSNDFSNLRPGLISFRTGGLITGVIGILMMPWKLMTDFSSYIFVWLVGCSAFLGPIAGIMIFDYYLVRRRQLVVEDLYRRPGAYEYKNGFNGKALLALAVGVAVALAGLLIPAVRWLYDYAWFVGLYRFRRNLLSPDAAGPGESKRMTQRKKEDVKQCRRGLTFLHPVSHERSVDFMNPREGVLNEKARVAGGPGGAGGGVASTDPARGLGRIDALPDVLRRALHSRLSHAYRHTEIHQEN